MNTYGQAFYFLKDQLNGLYDEREAAAIAHEVLTELTGLSKVERLIEKDVLLNTEQQNGLEYMLDELLAGKPLQYVTGKAYFMDKPYIVNEQVLIPRPETEELVFWILNDHTNPALQLLDIGTGSGCIPIALKMALPEATITSLDISEGALAVAALNAGNHEVSIQLQHTDILDETQWEQLRTYDVIVSNPPYIPEAEAATMHQNVKGFEPASALFVPDQDPLLFYRAIARLGITHLNPGGSIYCELHCDFGPQTKALFEQEGYTEVAIRKDMHDNWRMIRAKR